MTFCSTRPLRRLGACFTLAAALLGAPSGLLAKGSNDPQLAGEALVRLTTTAAIGPLLTKYRLTLVSQFGQRPIYRLKLVGKGDLAATIEAMSLEPDVLAAEPNFVHTSPEARKNVVWAIGTPQQYASQWAPAALNLPAAHAISTGAGVRVAVLDTGVDASHPALAGHLLPGFDFVDNDSDPAEAGSSGSAADLGFGHGTHVAGLVALAAPGARIVPLRVLNARGEGNVWVLAEAMLHAVDPDHNPATNDGVQVINLSLGTLDRTRVLDAVLQLATCSLPAPTAPDNDFTDPAYNGDRDRCQRFNGVVVVAAAGNGGSKSEKQYPAAEGAYGLLPIGATASNGRMASFSNYGSWIEVAAPGDRITSTVPGGGYGTWSGTSMAAPLASGAAALLVARFPTMSAKDVARRLEDTSRKLCDGQQRQIDALAALQGTRPAPISSCR